MSVKLGIDLLKQDLSYLESRYLAYISDVGNTLFDWNNIYTEWDNKRYMKTKSKQPRYVRVVKK
jgi:hypothetical protein